MQDATVNPVIEFEACSEGKCDTCLEADAAYVFRLGYEKVTLDSWGDPNTNAVYKITSMCSECLAVLRSSAPAAKEV